MSDRWEPRKFAGAKEGLEKKMAYWKDKDYTYEFGVSVGAAINIAAGLGDTSESLVDLSLGIFKQALECKLDPRFIEAFDNYYLQKKKSLEEKVAPKQGELPTIQIKE